jgi:hypothetical protein
MLKGNWDGDRKRKRQPARKWKNKQLGTPIKWTGPKPQPAGLLFALAPTQAAKDEHQRAWDGAFRECTEEQLRKLPLLAQEYGIDTGIDHWPLELLLALAAEIVPGFRVDSGRRRGPDPQWTDITQAELRADILVEKRQLKKSGLKGTDRAACRVLVSSQKYRSRYGKYSRGRSPKAIEFGAKLLNNQLVYARKSNGMVARLLKAWPGPNPHRNDSLIEAFAADPQEAKVAREGIAARTQPSSTKPK